MNSPPNTSAGIFFYASNTKRFLYLMRNDEKTQNTWGIPGGKLEINETILEGLARECTEEIGYFPSDLKLIPIQKFVNNNFTYHTFFCKIDDEFIPTLNDEHIGYCWLDKTIYPKPLHPGLFNTVNFDIVQEKLGNILSKIEQ